MSFRLAPKGVGRDVGLRNGGEVRITLLNTTDGRSLVATVVSRAVVSLYQSRQAPSSPLALDLEFWSLSPMERFFCAIRSYPFITR